MGNIVRRGAGESGLRWSFKRAAIVVPVLLVAWGGVAVVNAFDASASPGRGTAESQGTKLVFRAGTGAVNNVTVTQDIQTGGIYLTDAGNPIDIGPATDGNCTKLDSDTVRCPAAITSFEVYLFDGNDSFHTGLAVSTTINGSDGDDVLEGGNAGGIIRGGDGKDKIYGGDSKDSVYGGNGDDLIIGGGANDSLYGEAGKDEIRGGDGNERINGGAGADKVYGDNGADDLRSSDNTYGDTQYGGPGNDTLNTATDVYGEAGDDTVLMSTSDGEYWGGAGKDVISYASWGSEIYVSLDGNGNDGDSAVDCDDIFGCPVVATHNVHGDFEQVIGTAYNDKISGNNEPDILDGGAGNDRLYGNGGNDYLDAESGTGQRTDGGSGTDTCVGFGVTARPGCEL